MTTGELVFIDRYPNVVITWVDGATARVRAQLNVNTCFLRDGEAQGRATR
jgi:hypothetical protein